MEIKPIYAQTKVELFINQVESWIFSGQLKPGESLPSERDLATKMLTTVLKCRKSPI